MRMPLRRIAFPAIYVLLSCGLAVGVYAYSYREMLDQLAQSGAVRLAQGADRILGTLESHRELINVLARHPDVRAILTGAAGLAATNAFLLRIALTTGVERIQILNTEDVVTSASDGEEANTEIGSFLGFRPDVITARRGSLGFYHAVDPQTRRRYFHYARDVRAEDGTPLGLVVMTVDIAQVEFDWRVDEDAIAFFDRADVVFVSNRPGLLLTRDAPPSLEFVPTPRYPSDSVRPLPAHEKSTRFGHELWHFKEDGTLPMRAMVLSRFVPQLDMTEIVFKDTGPSRVSALLWASLATALFALLGLGLLVLSQRRQRLAERLKVEEAANATLEARVSERTEQLRRIQGELVQASKLTALGQMSAGISHELNQPLAAVQNFASNGRKLLERGRIDEAAQNLTEIVQQTDRMNRIIRNLRSFARNETAQLDDVDLNAVLGEAISLTEALCRDAQVTVRHHAPDGPMMIRGGRVRLQQVLVNLITNAVDAMSDSPRRIITVTLSQDRGLAHCILQDTGPGMADPSRVFEPFYTTKDVGASNGLGLGLSISFGIIGTFGGTIRAANLPGGGAEFHITLIPVKGIP